MSDNNTVIEKEKEEAEGSDQLDGASGTTSLNLTVTRPSCKYGKDCYRRNPDHKKAFSHPGDPDYEENSSSPASVDNRPECRFGTSCYRKNPQHIRDFKHTAPARRKKRKNVKKAEEDNEEEDENSDDYDYDDPFINDGSSDDYEPSSSGSDSSDTSSDNDNDKGEDDVRRMRKEAKRFLKKKT
ncbi:hypothetical protein J437_LFUL014269 [Ladona fulva]|uniref:PBZ-type domain-containing protein n=1 Tax=Ladona fulva TaxID=123851 RepID=A0A8K0KHD9_LADFU|nr:hypothetical protein J437_LFUL014269 [Ladona fulva]